MKVLPDSETAFCVSCGTTIAADSRFCGSCGAAQPVPESPPRSQPTPPSASAEVPAGAPGDAASGGGARFGNAERVEQVAPDAREFAGALAGELSTPGAALALTAGAFAAATALVVGFVAAVLSPDQSFIGGLGSGQGVFSEGMNLAVGTTLAHAKSVGAVSFSGGAMLPLIFILAPIGGAAAGAWIQAPKTAGLSPTARLAWGAGAAAPLTVVMLILALAAGKGVGIEGDRFFDGYSIGSVILMSIVCGAVGGIAGTWLVIRRDAPESLGGLLPPAVSFVGRVVRPAVVSLLGVIVVAGLIGLATWETQVIRGEYEDARSTLTALVESALYAPNYGLSGANLGMFGQSRFSASMGIAPNADGPIPLIRIFDYSDFYASWLFIPLVIIMVGVPILLALYSGFATARAVEASNLASAAGFGAITGVVWCLVLIVVCAIADVGAVGGTLFGLSLLVGCTAGALGGLLAGSKQEAGTTQPPAATFGPLR